MKSFRKRAWFSLTPSMVFLDAERVERIGVKGLSKILKVSRKHKTSVFVCSIPFTKDEVLKSYMQGKTITFSHSQEEYESTMKRLGIPFSKLNQEKFKHIDFNSNRELTRYNPLETSNDKE